MRETIKIGTLKWQHILKPDDDDLKYLRNTYHFHPLDLEDCKSVNQRPKLDVYDDYYFLILHFPVFDSKNTFLHTNEVKIFWGKDYIITIGKTEWIITKMFNEAKDQAKRKEEFEVRTSDKLLYRLLERLMTESLLVIRKIGSELEYLHRELFSVRAQRTIGDISITRKNIILLNTLFKPQLRLFHKFETGAVNGFAENMEDYWGNILDYYQKMWDMTEDYEDLIEGLSKTFDSLQANRINEIMKVLTLVSSILLPLTFITGLYGMNVGLPLQGNPNSFWIVVGAMILIAGGMITLFKFKKWM